MNTEKAILEKAASLGAALPLFRQCDRPELFAGYADRIALADSLRHCGKEHVDAVEEANSYIGRPTIRLPIYRMPALIGDGLGLDWLANAMGAASDILEMPA